MDLISTVAGQSGNAASSSAVGLASIWGAGQRMEMAETDWLLEGYCYPLYACVTSGIANWVASVRLPGWNVTKDSGVPVT